MFLVVGSRGNYNSTKAIIDATDGKISEIYLSVENSRWGSGRNYVYEVDFQDISCQVGYARNFGVDISLAFNTVCFGLSKFSKEFLNDFLTLLEKAQEAGIRNIILSDPYLMEITKREAPSLRIIVSVFSEVDSELRLRFYNELGVHRIIIPHELNRNLEKLKRFVEISSCDLEVILNLGCSHYCARGDAHSMFTGHYTGNMRKRVIGDYYTSYCNRFKLNYPWKFLSQDWIRPENIYRYEEIGIKYFKVAGRATSTQWIIRTAKAYLKRSYEGNIFELISSYYPFTDRMPKKSPFYIPNKKIDEIIDHLYQCGHKCYKCNVCEDFYKALV